MDGRDIKLDLFDDDLTVFVRNEESLQVFLDATANFGKCTRFTLNFGATEMLFSWNPVFTPLGQTISKIEIKKAVKILWVFFTYDRQRRWKLNFKETIESIKSKHPLSKWYNLTIIGRIQISKTILIIMYRAGSICIEKEVTTEVSRIIFEFIWKESDKVK